VTWRSCSLFRVFVTFRFSPPNRQDAFRPERSNAGCCFVTSHRAQAAAPKMGHTSKWKLAGTRVGRVFDAHDRGAPALLFRVFVTFRFSPPNRQDAFRPERSNAGCCLVTSHRAQAAAPKMGHTSKWKLAGTRVGRVFDAHDRGARLDETAGQDVAQRPTMPPDGAPPDRMSLSDRRCRRTGRRRTDCG
jgi:hypothetical protein